ncbi:MAG TPA: KamA family radical SAM protein, partial [bacterium]|nr:KamA family radical SAM protein [bacterium]
MIMNDNSSNHSIAQSVNSPQSEEPEPADAAQPPHNETQNFQQLENSIFYLEAPTESSIISNFKRAQKLNEAVKPSVNSLNFLKKYYSKAAKKEWNNWQWQLKNSITKLNELKRIVNLTKDEEIAFEKNDKLPIRITPYYASLIDAKNINDPLRKCMVPVADEFIKSVGEENDPLSEDKQSPVKGLVHRYPDRVLFLSTGFCFANCRYCTRSRIVGHQGAYNLNSRHWDKMIEYIEQNKNIRDVLISGGDPLTLQNEHLEYLISRLRNIKHIEIIRIGTKAPVVLPQRVTQSLAKMLKRYHPVWMNIHFIHPNEITPEVIQACEMLADAGIPLGSQTVLLKGVNDSVDTLKRLYHQLVKM